MNWKQQLVLVVSMIALALLVMVFVTENPAHCIQCPDLLCSATSDLCGDCDCVVEDGHRIGRCG